MKKLTKINAATHAKVSKEILVREASRLYDVLRALGKTKTDVTSDQLWEAIMQRWSESELLAALKTFERSKKVDAFEELFDSLPQARKDGFFEADGELWGTIGALKKKLRLSSKTIEKRASACRARNGKDYMRRTLIFYSLKDMKRECVKLLEAIPRAEKDGFFKKDGELWGTIGALKKLLKIDRTSIDSRRASFRSREGRDHHGRYRQFFYSLSDVKKGCASLLSELPSAEDDGFFEKDGELWGTEMALARKLLIDKISLRRRLIKSRMLEGKNRSGRVAKFYPLADTQKTCTDLLIPRVRKGAFFKIQGELWGTIDTLAQKLSLNRNTIRNRSSSLRSQRRRVKGGQQSTCYCLSDVRKACADLLQSTQKTGLDGFFTVQGEVWGTRTALAKWFGVTHKTVELRSSSSRSCRGRNSQGRVLIFYSLNDIERAFAVKRLRVTKKTKVLSPA